MDLVLACVVRIMHNDWLIKLGENRPDRVLKHLEAMLGKYETITYNDHSKSKISKSLRINRLANYIPFQAF